jgi:hypothetical protein
MRREEHALDAVRILRGDMTDLKRDLSDIQRNLRELKTIALEMQNKEEYRWNWVDKLMAFLQGLRQAMT